MIINEVKVTPGNRILITIGAEDMSAPQLRSYASALRRSHSRAYKVPVSVATVRSQGPLLSVTIIKDF